MTAKDAIAGGVVALTVATACGSDRSADEPAVGPDAAISECQRQLDAALGGTSTFDLYARESAGRWIVTGTADVYKPPRDTGGRWPVGGLTVRHDVRCETTYQDGGWRLSAPLRW